MNKFYIFFLLGSIAMSAKAQTQPTIPAAQPFGKIDKADLEMTSCDFEKDANAEVLFDKASVVPVEDVLMMEHHTRIKIFNDFGKYEGNVRIVYPSFEQQVTIGGLEAETINLNNGKIEFTQLDKKGTYTETVDKIRSALIFVLPNVKAGSVIEFKYRVAIRYLPTWYFQSHIPTRYSEFQIDLPNSVEFRAIPHVSLPYVKNVGESLDLRQIKALANIHSLPDELYMGAFDDNLQRIEYLGMNTLVSSWAKIGELATRFTDFGDEFGKNVTGGSAIVKQAKGLKSDDEKIAFVFDTVKNSMKWDEITRFYTIDGTPKAWDKKTGNSAEINLILYNLLKKAGIKAYPMLVSTKKNGKINPANPNIFQFNNTVVYIPVDSTKYYVLDASGKYNLFNVVPTDELNSFGLKIDADNKEYKTVFLESAEPAMQSVFLNAEISPAGKMAGSAEITSYSYNKINAAEKYKTAGEVKYIDYLRNNDNNLKVSSLKLSNMEVDSLPLTQKVDFSTDLTGSDETYIYFGSNLFTLMGANPFINENRYSDIDFGYRNNYSISGIYKLPAGYKTDALPKSITIVMPDQSIIFKRTVAVDNGTVLIRYVLNHKKALYFKKDYDDIRGFYKKMYELLNEQIVLKKS
jgi:hypothetical protein